LIELAQSGIEINMNKLEILVRSHLIQQYNPIREYFENLETWDGRRLYQGSLNILKPMMMKHFIIILKNG
jgi:hypothetical protein